MDQIEVHSRGLGHHPGPVGYTPAHGCEIDSRYDGPQCTPPGEVAPTLQTVHMVRRNEGIGAVEGLGE